MILRVWATFVLGGISFAMYEHSSGLGALVSFAPLALVAFMWGKELWDAA